MRTLLQRTVAVAVLATLAACSDSGAPTDTPRDPGAPADTLPVTPALACPGPEVKGHILVDASRDGGVWWYPQGEAGFDAAAPHQGQGLADYLRSRGYVVDELSRGRIVSDTLLATYAGAIRAGQYGTYTEGELRAYDWFLDCGSTLVLLGEFLHEGGRDKLAESIGVPFQGKVTGVVTTFAEHPITQGMDMLAFTAGSILTEPIPTGITVLGWLDTGEAVMGVVTHPRARIFFLGDTNGLEEVPQPLVDNLIAWGFQ